MIRNKASIAFMEAINRAEKNRYEPEVATSLLQTKRSKCSPKILQNLALKNLLGHRLFKRNSHYFCVVVPFIN